MARLIDADKLEESVFQGSYCDNADKDVTYEIIEKSPTVYAVPVVRCKDCRCYDRIVYYYKDNDENYKIETWKGYCKFHNGLPEKNDDDFCSYGLRKDGTADE